ncbi:hypothetical protein [Vibrio phage PJN101]|nr:hypothetical protein [Vibrio phage PJN101]
MEFLALFDFSPAFYIVIGLILVFAFGVEVGCKFNTRLIRELEDSIRERNNKIVCKEAEISHLERVIKTHELLNGE